MEIYIDGNVLDVTLEDEQTVGDLFVSLEKWLSDTGFRFAAFALDGKNIHASGVEEAFAANVRDVSRIEVKTASVAQLCAEALLDASFFLRNYSAADAGTGKEEIVAEWKTSGGRSFLLKDHPALAKKIDDCFFQGTSDGAKLGGEIDELLEEIKNPEAALLSMKENIYDITGRLEVLALNMQMGKDREATETVYQFSEAAEKLFRIIPLMPAVANDAAYRTFFEEFTGVLKEFFAAYQAQDSVLTGDLAEYEVSPRLIELYDRLIEKKESASAASASAESAARAC
ncbi:MAG: hypothetical protein LBK61_12050 [Spirochaetaceae bacterium]|jgi:hypothetical protein|nr:hypothetical protein [Spirochaetaceae bacterium]